MKYVIKGLLFVVGVLAFIAILLIPAIGGWHLFHPVGFEQKAFVVAGICVVEYFVFSLAFVVGTLFWSKTYGAIR